MLRYGLSNFRAPRPPPVKGNEPRTLLHSFLDNANDPTKEAHFNLAVDLINDHSDGFHDDLLADTTLASMVFSSNCNSVAAA